MPELLAKETSTSSPLIEPPQLSELTELSLLSPLTNFPSLTSSPLTVDDAPLPDYLDATTQEASLTLVSRNKSDKPENGSNNDTPEHEHKSRVPGVPPRPRQQIIAIYTNKKRRRRMILDSVFVPTIVSLRRKWILAQTSSKRQSSKISGNSKRGHDCPLVGGLAGNNVP